MNGVVIVLVVLTASLIGWLIDEKLGTHLG